MIIVIWSQQPATLRRKTPRSPMSACAYPVFATRFSQHWMLSALRKRACARPNPRPTLELRRTHSPLEHTSRCTRHSPLEHKSRCTRHSPFEHTSRCPRHSPLGHTSRCTRHSLLGHTIRCTRHSPLGHTSRCTRHSSLGHTSRCTSHSPLGHTSRCTRHSPLGQASRCTRCSLQKTSLSKQETSSWLPTKVELDPRFSTA